MVLDVADDGAFEDPVARWDVADGELGAAAVVVHVVKLQILLDAVWEFLAASCLSPHVFWFLPNGEPPVG